MENLNLKNKFISYLKEVIKIIKIGIEFVQSKQQGYLNHADVFIYKFDQM